MTQVGRFAARETTIGTRSERNAKECNARWTCTSPPTTSTRDFASSTGAWWCTSCATACARLDADIVFLQEVQGEHERHATRFHDWPDEPQYEFLADEVWGEFAYGRNAVYDHGHHGNAILSRFPIVAAENQDVSSHPFESRGLLHCEVKIPATRVTLHCLCVHFALVERGRRRQLHALIDRILELVPEDAPLIVAGDFNDWRNRAGHRLAHELGLVEVFRDHRGRPARSFPSRLPLFRLDRIYVRGFLRAPRRGAPRARVVAHLRPRAADRAPRALLAARRSGMELLDGNRLQLLRDRRRVLPGARGRDRRRAPRDLPRDLHFRRRRDRAAHRPGARRGGGAGRAHARAGRRHDGEALRRGLARPAARGGRVVRASSGPTSRPGTSARGRLRRLHRKIAVIDARVAFVGGINIIDDMHTPGRRPPRYDYAVRIEGPLVDAIRDEADRLWRLVALSNFRQWSERRAGAAAAAETVPRGIPARGVPVRDNFRHRSDIEDAYLAAIEQANEEIIIANAYFFPGVRVPPRAGRGRAPRRARGRAAAGARRVRAAALRVARALRPLLDAGVQIYEYDEELPAREGRGGRRALGDGRLVEHRPVQPAARARGQRRGRGPEFAQELRESLLERIATGGDAGRARRGGARSRSRCACGSGSRTASRGC